MRYLAIAVIALSLQGCPRFYVQPGAAVFAAYQAQATQDCSKCPCQDKKP